MVSWLAIRRLTVERVSTYQECKGRVQRPKAIAIINFIREQNKEVEQPHEVNTMKFSCRGFGDHVIKCYYPENFEHAGAVKNRYKDNR